MKLNTWLLCLVMTSIPAPAFAAVDSGEVLHDEAPSAQPLAGGAPIVALRNGIYQVGENTPIIPREFEQGGELMDNQQFQEFQIPKNVPFALHVEGDNVYLMPIIAKDLRGKTPDTFVFAADDLAEADLQFIMEGDQITLYQTFSEYSDTMVAVGRCKFYVEKHFGFWIPGLCASTMSASKLSKVGFYPADCGSAEMKVWGGGPGGCGHVAWRAGSTWSSGDYVGEPGHRFYSLGCYSRSGGFHRSEPSTPDADSGRSSRHGRGHSRGSRKHETEGRASKHSKHGSGKRRRWKSSKHAKHEA